MNGSIMWQPGGWCWGRSSHHRTQPFVNLHTCCRGYFLHAMIGGNPDATASVVEVGEHWEPGASAWQTTTHNLKKQ